MTKNQITNMLNRFGVNNLLKIFIDNERNYYFNYNDYVNNRVKFDDINEVLIIKEKIRDTNVISIIDYNDIQTLIFKDLNPEQPLT